LHLALHGPFLGVKSRGLEAESAASANSVCLLRKQQGHHSMLVMHKDKLSNNQIDNRQLSYQLLNGYIGF
jgi:hypothetical protein